MNIVILYDTATGRTEAAAHGMGRILTGHGHTCTVLSIYGADPTVVSDADLVCAGCWTHGLFVVLQRPTHDWLRFIAGLDQIRGRKVVVFCTYRLAAGRTLKKMARAVAHQGGDVIARFKFRDPRPSAAFERFAASL